MSSASTIKNIYSDLIQLTIIVYYDDYVGNHAKIAYKLNPKIIKYTSCVKTIEQLRSKKEKFLYEFSIKTELSLLFIISYIQFNK